MVLEGVRVLDFGRYIAGPCCGTLLGDFGADVIRVERVGGGEDRFVTPVAEGGEGAMFIQFARNKRGLTLDPTHETGREIVRKLVATADVVVANLPEPALVAMGLDYESLQAINPRIILVANSAFGRQGPWAERVGFDGVSQAMSSAMDMTGEASAPVRSFVPWVDLLTAVSAAFGTLLALREREQSGRGQEVQTSLLATGLFGAGSHLIEQYLLDSNRVATGNRGQLAAPADTFATLDGWILVHIVGNSMFKRWARLMGAEDWVDNPRFADDASRGANSDVISERMAEWCGSRTNEQVLDSLAQARIPAGPVLNAAATLEHPQVLASEAFAFTPYPGLDKPAPLVEAPLTLSRTPGGVRRQAPTLGEHNDEIYAELGYTPNAIAKLHAQGVI